MESEGISEGSALPPVLSLRNIFVAKNMSFLTQPFSRQAEPGCRGQQPVSAPRGGSSMRVRSKWTALPLGLLIACGAQDVQGPTGPDSGDFEGIAEANGELT